MGVAWSPGDGRTVVRASAGLYYDRVPLRATSNALQRDGSKYRVAVLAFSRPDERVDYWLRMPREASGYAQRLYGALRELDGAQCELILVEAPPEAPDWVAVNVRLRRACSKA